MSPVALSAVQWDFESFPEFLASRRGKLGVNMACYVGHSAVRRTVMGEAGSEREATDDRDRADARAWWPRPWRPGRRASPPRTARPSSTATTAPSPAASRRWPSSRSCAPRPAATTAGRSATSTAAPSAGSTSPTRTCSCASGRRSRLPIILQGLGGRSKVDVPGAGWERRVAVDRRGRPPGRRASSRCCATIPSTVTSASRPAPTSTRGCRRGTGSSGPASARGRSARPPARPVGARRDAPRRRAPQHRRGQGLDPAAAALERGRGRRGGQAAQREVRAAHHRRHRRRARQGAGRRPARPGPRRGPRAPSFRYVNKSRAWEEAVAARPEPPRHDHRRLRRRAPISTATTGRTGRRRSSPSGCATASCGASRRASAS